MEMHQIRYFLAVSRTLNFTRAAEECHVAQPSLTRAVKLLEEELGGDLFRRERNNTHLTEMGERMLPLLRQCYESANAARNVAKSLNKGEIAPLKLALSRTISMELLVQPLTQLSQAIAGLELKFLRGSAEELVERMKNGDAELAVAGPLSEQWERFDGWPLFSEPFMLIVGDSHPLSGRNEITLEDVAGSRYLHRPYCELAGQSASLLSAHGVDIANAHHVSSENDLMVLARSNVGVGFLPQSQPLVPGLRRVPVAGANLTRTISVYAVAGRPRSPAVTMLLNLLRAHDWG